MKSRALLPPLSRSPSLPEGGWVCADFAVSASEIACIYNFIWFNGYISINFMCAFVYISAELFNKNPPI